MFVVFVCCIGIDVLLITDLWMCVHNLSLETFGIKKEKMWPNYLTITFETLSLDWIGRNKILQTILLNPTAYGNAQKNSKQQCK